MSSNQTSYIRHPIISLPSYREFDIHQPWCQAVGDGKAVVVEIFNKGIADGVGPVEQVKHFYTQQHAFEIAERIVAAAQAFIATHQQVAKAHVYPEIRRNFQRISVAYTTGNIVRQIAAIQELRMHPKVFIGSKVVAEK